MSNGISTSISTMALPKGSIVALLQVVVGERLH